MPTRIHNGRRDTYARATKKMTPPWRTKWRKRIGLAFRQSQFPDQRPQFSAFTAGSQTISTHRKNDRDAFFVLRYEARRPVQQRRAGARRRVMKSPLLVAEYVADARDRLSHRHPALRPLLSGPACHSFIPRLTRRPIGSTCGAVWVEEPRSRSSRPDSRATSGRRCP